MKLDYGPITNDDQFSEYFERWSDLTEETMFKENKDPEKIAERDLLKYWIDRWLGTIRLVAEVDVYRGKQVIRDRSFIKAFTHLSMTEVIRMAREN